MKPNQAIGFIELTDEKLRPHCSLDQVDFGSATVGRLPLRSHEKRTNKKMQNSVKPSKTRCKGRGTMK